ncbi:hypothetical protein BCR34DRAFT_614807 [Clohesyomyces aquaticus]|uniref:Major facilitator superfamily domain-containing protein n=1 Tax=Clohesyomyces aquaticus TaxID=1231657 RepID=A0A1Y1ZLQ6_9PLEO|nr:hypothetical protein BCR34DRAFT_614807 [Clohesyomyces aquaticus]
MTLFLTSAFGIAAGGSPNWISAAALFWCLGLSIGGNLPVDGALFLEFLPLTSGNLLTMLSVFWPVGQLVASLIAWGLIPKFSCPIATSSGAPTPTCSSTRVGLAYHLYNTFLPQYLANLRSGAPTSTYIIYRNYPITSAPGAPGSLLATILLDIPHIGRTRTIVVGTGLTGIFCLCFTVLKDPNLQLAFTCLEALF